MGRLRYFAIGILIGLTLMGVLSSLASAAFSPIDGVRVNATGTLGAATEAEACSHPKMPSHSAHGIGYCVPAPPGLGISGNACRIWLNAPEGDGACTGSFGSSEVREFTTGTYCPANSTLGGGNCTCNAGYTQSGSSCVISCPSAGTMVQGYMPQSGGSPVNVCLGGCQATTVDVGGASSGGVDYWRGTWAYTGGGSCSGVPTATAGTLGDVPKCGAGMVAGTFMGTSMCLPTSVANPQKQVTQTTVKNDDGTSTTTTNTTTNTGGSTTTNTVVQNYNSGGSPTGDPINTSKSGPANDGKKTDQEEFCVQFPDSPMCKQSSWSGSCPSFSCDGDAVQCAIAKEIHERNCKWFEEHEATKTLGGQILDGSDPKAGDMPWHASKRESVDASKGFLGGVVPSGFWSTSCPSDYDFTLAGHTVTVKLSTICQPLQMVGVILVAFSMLMGLRIALGAT